MFGSLIYLEFLIFKKYNVYSVYYNICNALVYACSILKNKFVFLL